MIKLFASDLDGTLLNLYHQVDDEISEGIKEVQETGKIVSSATGRSPLMCEDLKGLGIYMICNNGATILDDKGNLMYQDPINKKLLKEMLTELKDEPLEYVGNEKVYIMADHLEMRPFKSEEQPKDMKEPDWIVKSRKFSCTPEEILSHDIVKINGHRYDAIPNKKIDDFLEKHKDSLVNAATNEELYEINNVHTSKASGVKKLAELLNLNEDEVAVYGDAGNDLAMLKAFENSYCPANGTKEAKAAARHMIGNNKDHSVIRHMVKCAKENL